MIKWIRNWWWARQRAIDLQILWPICKEKADSIEVARQAFMVHAVQEPCWASYYGYRLWTEISKLT